MVENEMLFINRLANADSFYFAKLVTTEIANPITLFNNIQKEILKHIKKLGSGKSFKYNNSELAYLTYMNVLQEPLVNYYPASISIKDDVYLYVIELTGKIDYSVGFDKDYVSLINQTNIKTRVLIDKDNNDIETISKFVARYYLCPFIQENTEALNKYLEISYFFDMLKSMVPLNKIVLLNMTKDKVITNMINEILGLNDLGKMLKWKKEKEFRKIQEKIVNIVNNYVTVGKLFFVDKIIDPDYFTMS